MPGVLVDGLMDPSMMPNFETKIDGRCVKERGILDSLAHWQP